MLAMTDVLLSAIERIDVLAGEGRVHDAVAVAQALRIGLGDDFRSRTRHAGLDLPDLLLLGPARTGSTWLKLALGYHPEIQMARGEPNVLWEAGSGGLHRALSWYAQSDVWRGGPKSGAMVAEKNPGYIRLPDAAISVLTTLNPDLLVILGQRTEEERIWSVIHHRMRAIDFRGNWQDFCQQHEEEVIHHLDCGRLEHHLARWKSTLPERNFLVIEFANISCSPRETLDSALNHISVQCIDDLDQFDQLALLQRVQTNPNPGNASRPPADFMLTFAALVSPKY